MQAFRRSARAELTRLLLWSIVMHAALACKTKAKPASGGPAGSARVQARDSSCVPIHPALAVVLGTKSEKSPVPEDDEEPETIDLPFSVELGQARAGANAFVVPAIENRRGSNFAVAAIVESTSGEGRVLDLGRVYGDVDAPVVAPFGDRWLFAVPDGDAAGIQLRLMLVAPPYRTEDVRRGAEVTGVRRDDTGYALSFFGERGLLVFNTLDKGRGRVAVLEIDPRGPALRGRPTLLPANADDDVDGPRLAARPSGHYLAYLVRTPSKRHRPLRSDDGPDAGSAEDSIQEGPSALEIVPLDAQGAPTASALRLSPPGAHVLAFDLAPLGDGGALVVYREARGPGLDRADAQAVRVRPDGSFERRTWEVGESSGVPALVLDVAPRAPELWGWVTISDEQTTKIAPIGVDPLALAELREEPGLVHSEFLAARAGRFLAATVQGTQQKLSIFECGPR